LVLADLNWKLADKFKFNSYQPHINHILHNTWTSQTILKVAHQSKNLYRVHDSRSI
jgi:hypothetical protein